MNTRGERGSDRGRLSYEKMVEKGGKREEERVQMEEKGVNNEEDRGDLERNCCRNNFLDPERGSKEKTRRHRTATSGTSTTTTSWVAL